MSSCTWQLGRQVRALLYHQVGGMYLSVEQILKEEILTLCLIRNLNKVWALLLIKTLIPDLCAMPYVIIKISEDCGTSILRTRVKICGSCSLVLG